MKQKNNLKPLDQFVEERYCKKGTSERDKFEKGFESFKLTLMCSGLQAKSDQPQGRPCEQPVLLEKLYSILRLFADHLLSLGREILQPPGRVAIFMIMESLNEKAPYSDLRQPIR